MVVPGLTVVVVEVDLFVVVLDGIVVELDVETRVVVVVLEDVATVVVVVVGGTLIVSLHSSFHQFSAMLLSPATVRKTVLTISQARKIIIKP